MNGKFTTIGFIAVEILLVVVMSDRVFADSLTTIDFNGIPGNDGSAFTSYSESGFTVSSIAGSWLVVQSFGNPAPFIEFTAQPASTITSVIAVTHAGSAFSFSSIEIYSSITPIPYTFTGLLGGTTVFTVSGVVPNPMGNFLMVMNPDSTLSIDALMVALTTSTPSCCDNFVGLDNIALVTPTSNVPEPSSLMLFGTGAVGLLGAIRRKLLR